jgi:hypothetical protein
VETIRLSKTSRDAAKALFALCMEGKDFGKKREVLRTCEVYQALNAIVDAAGKDLAGQIGEKEEGHGSGEILHNLKIIHSRRVSQHYCAVGVHDYDAGQS